MKKTEPKLDPLAKLYVFMGLNSIGKDHVMLIAENDEELERKKPLAKLMARVNKKPYRLLVYKYDSELELPEVT